MDDISTKTVNEIKKLHIKETVAFAVKNIPQVDPATLEKFVELVNTAGTFGSITDEEFVKKMRLTLKYVPGTCPNSLMILVELLGLRPHNLSQTRRALPSSPVVSLATQIEPLPTYAEI